MEKLIYDPLNKDKPFRIVQINQVYKGIGKVYTRDELKKLGKIYDTAAHEAILTMYPVIIKND